MLINEPNLIEGHPVKKKDIVIFGNSGHANVIHDIIQSRNTYHLKSFIGQEDEDAFLKEPICLYGIVAIGDQEIRKKVVRKILDKIPNFIFISLVHQSATIGDNVVIGSGSVVMPGAVINNNTQVGNHCIINTKTSIDHDCILDEYVSVSPGVTLCGNVSINKNTVVGAGSVIINNIKIGSNCIIGAGSVVVKDIEDSSFGFGNPFDKKKKTDL